MNNSSFQMLRLPREYWSKRHLWAGVGLVLGSSQSRTLPLGLIVLGMWAVWLLYRIQRPVRTLQLTESELGISGTSLLIRRREVEEVSPSSKGLTIAWRRNGIARYTEIKEMHFTEDVWSRARGILLAWGK